MLEAKSLPPDRRLKVDAPLRPMRSDLDVEARVMTEG